MKLEVNCYDLGPLLPSGYVATIWDGPDLCNEQTFINESLEELFKKILEWRRTNALSYLED